MPATGAAVNAPQLLRADSDPLPLHTPARIGSPASRRLLAAGLVAALVAGGAGYWAHARRFETTDNAQVDGDISNLSPRVFGTVKVVHVVDHQRVRAGQLLVELDPADQEVAVAQAQAAVAEAEAQLRAEDPSVDITATSAEADLASSASEVVSAQAAVAEARKSVEQLTAQLAQAEAGDRTAQAERRRVEILVERQVIPQSEAEQLVNAAEASAANARAVRHALDAALDRVSAHGAKVAMARSRLVEARDNGPRQLAARRAQVQGRRASLDLARARLAQAELNLSYTRIHAPAAGVVGKKSVTTGDRVAPGQQLMAIAQVEALWVTANYRETQLRHLRPGQAVRIDVDATGWQLTGIIESIGGATGSRFSVLPPENATGNYVKVVQRIPVRIRLHGDPSQRERLRPGMSVEARTRVR